MKNLEKIKQFRRVCAFYGFFYTIRLFFNNYVAIRRSKALLKYRKYIDKNYKMRIDKEASTELVKRLETLVDLISKITKNEMDHHIKVSNQYFKNLYRGIYGVVPHIDMYSEN